MRPSTQFFFLRKKKGKVVRMRKKHVKKKRQKRKKKQKVIKYSCSLFVFLGTSFLFFSSCPSLFFSPAPFALQCRPLFTAPQSDLLRRAVQKGKLQNKRKEGSKSLLIFFSPPIRVAKERITLWCGSSFWYKKTADPS